ncbi:MAG: ABC transporter ATP-binding protein [Lentisphaerae bacterium]|nr:ABC transporter ATP-binding protein [Lentisphaerota bacterium]MCP4101702.1 ABC transporter ATP-binding protein [Lentisphaerota bacterium]
MEKNNIHIDIKNVFKSYSIGKKKVEVLKDVNWQIERDSWTALLGASGSGKTTLLTLLGMLEKPDSGKVFCGDIEYDKLSKRQSNRFRNATIGFVFQSYHMFPELSVLENVYLPGMIGFGVKNYKKKAMELLDKVGLKERMHHRPSELSGGEQQRAAIARALINEPEILLADEPTGNLDSVTGKGILSLFQEIHNEKSGRTIIMITHDPNVAALADKIATLKDGQIITQTDK